MSDKNGESDEKEVVDVDDSDEEEDEPIDDEQLEEYREMVDNLGTFPVGVKIPLYPPAPWFYLEILTSAICYHLVLFRTR